MADQCAACGSDGRPNGCAAHTTRGESANKCAGASAGRSSLASWRIARVQTERGEQNATNNCEKLFVHIDFFVSPLNAQLKRMLRSKNELPAVENGLWLAENFFRSLVQNQRPVPQFSGIVDPA